MRSPSGSLRFPPDHNDPPANGYTTVEAFGMRLPVPKWGAYCIALLVILGIGTFLFTKLGLPLIKQWANSHVPDQDVQYKEYQKHYSDKPSYTQNVFNNPDLGSLTIDYFSSDGCMLMRRKPPGPNQPEMLHWILATSIKYDPPPGELPGNPRSSSLDRPPNSLLALSTGLSPVRLANEYELIADGPLVDLQSSSFEGILNLSVDPSSFAGEISNPVQACRGRCLDPHPGQFQSWAGQTSGCWVQIWRKWPDSCLHYQWYNSCYNYWDLLPNGAPRVYWTCCVH
jgi:hypothetical protein